MKDETLLSPELLLQAYRAGVFPMSESRDDPEIFWVDPRMRGIIPIDGFHISRSLAKYMRGGGFYATANTSFTKVVSACADRDETWINETIFGLYTQLHRQGHAHSVEIWKDYQLVGGVYGVAIGGAFFGESMFSRATNGSKMALVYLVHRLQRQGYTLFDTQFLTPHLATLGAIEIPREDYHKKLIDALPRTVSFGDRGAMQLMTTQCNAAPKHRIADDPAHEARAPKQSTSP